MQIVVHAYFLLIILSAFNMQALNADQRINNLVDCTSTFQEPMNLNTLKEQIRAYRFSGMWQEAIDCVVHKALTELKKYRHMPGKLAVVFDIDETLLSNWEFIIRTGFGYYPELFKNWENSAQDMPISVKKIFDTARSYGMSLFCITGRRENQRMITELNLEKAGFFGWTALYFKSASDKSESVIPFKSRCRQHIKDLGYTIVMSIGDQMSDLLGEPQALVNVKIPNPMYVIP
jgi:predicted secreted acid phosphatase